MAISPAVRRAMRTERLEAGLCAILGCLDTYEVGKSMCQLHLDRVAESARRHRARHVTAGRCQQCKRAPLVPDRKHCKDCLREAAARAGVSYRKDPSKADSRRRPRVT